MPDTDASALFDPQTALALMAPGLVSPDGQIDLDAYRRQRMYQGLIGLGAGMLSASGPSLTPVGFGQALGSGLQGYMTAQQGYDKSALAGAQAGRLLADTGKLAADAQTERQKAAAMQEAYGDIPPWMRRTGSGQTASATIADAPGGTGLMSDNGGPKASDLLADASPIANYANYADRVAGVEAGGNPNAKNPNSSATGLGQFTSGTWLDVAKRYFPKTAEMADSDLLSLRTVPQFSKAMINAYAQDNAGVLSGAGIPVNNATLYAAHFLGPKGAVDALSASPDTPLAKVLPAAAINANPSLRNQTAGQFAANMAMKMGVSGNVGSTMRPQTAGADDTVAGDMVISNQQQAEPVRMAQATSAAPGIVVSGQQPQLTSVRTPGDGAAGFPPSTYTDADIAWAQARVRKDAAFGIKTPPDIVEVAKLPVARDIATQNARIELAKEYAGPGANVALQSQLQGGKTAAEEAARDPYLRGREEFQAQQQRLTQGTAPQSLQPGGTLVYPPGSAGAAQYIAAQRQGMVLPTGAVINKDGSVTVRGPDAGENEFNKNLAEKMSTDLIADQKNAEAANRAITESFNARKLLNSGMITGAGADIRLQFAKLFNLAGSSDAESIANTEAFIASRASQVAAIARQFGTNTGISEGDRRFAEAASGGKINFNKESIEKILDLNEKSSRYVIDYYNKKVSRQAPKYADQISVDSPPSYSEWLNRRGDAAPAGSSGASGVTSSGIRWSIK